MEKSHSLLKSSSLELCIAVTHISLARAVMWPLLDISKKRHPWLYPVEWEHIFLIDSSPSLPFLTRTIQPKPTLQPSHPSLLWVHTGFCLHLGCGTHQNQYSRMAGSTPAYLLALRAGSAPFTGASSQHIGQYLPHIRHMAGACYIEFLCFLSTFLGYLCLDD